MKLNKNKFSIALASALLAVSSSAFAAGQDSLEIKQLSLLEKLDSLNDAVLGLRINGTAHAGILSSTAKSDQLAPNSATQENQAFTDVNLLLTAHPGAGTEVRVELKLHKDWQSAFEENNNPIVGHWFSYDGLILDKHLAFNLGYMRVGYTPLTLYTPQPELLQEPEIFAQKRVDVLAQRNLDTTSRRLLQGLNADFHSGAVGILDDIHVQATGARLRNSAKKYDQIFFDFDWSDRYALGGRLGFDAFGAHLGGNYMMVFDREKTMKSVAMPTSLSDEDTINVEDNSVFSGELGFDSQKLLADLPVTFGLFGEFAMSKWEAKKFFREKQVVVDYVVQKGGYPDQSGASYDSLAYLQRVEQATNVIVSKKNGDLDGKSFYIEPYVNGSFGDVSFSLKGRYLQNDEDFWSELASAPALRSNQVILNSNNIYVDEAYSSLISGFGNSSLENLYFSVYNTNPLTLTSIMNMTSNGKGGSVLVNNVAEHEDYTYSRLYNNYKSAHFYRNGYNADTKKRLEVGQVLALMDPSVNIALPMGLATPDRKGFAVSLDIDYSEAIELNARFSKYNQDAIDNEYTQYAAGLGVDVGHLIGLDRKIAVQGSYDHSEESAFFKRSSDRIMAGLDVDVWGPIALLAGFQSATKEYGLSMNVSEFASITKTEESLLLVGPRIKIAPASYLTIQYGMLNDKVAFDRIAEDGSISADELSIDKNVIVADVTVNF